MPASWLPPCQAALWQAAFLAQAPSKSCHFCRDNQKPADLSLLSSARLMHGKLTINYAGASCKRLADDQRLQGESPEESQCVMCLSEEVLNIHTQKYEVSSFYRIRVERFMQGVFLLSAAAMFIPVIFHTATVKESDSLNRDAPGDFRKMLEAFGVKDKEFTC